MMPATRVGNHPGRPGAEVDEEGPAAIGSAMLMSAIHSPEQELAPPWWRGLRPRGFAGGEATWPRRPAMSGDVGTAVAGRVGWLRRGARRRDRPCPRIGRR